MRPRGYGRTFATMDLTDKAAMKTRMLDYGRTLLERGHVVEFATHDEACVRRFVDELGGRRRRRESRRRADQLLEELGLADRADNLAGQLSGGQRQRVAVGRALMNEPDLVLFDEPTSALDTKLGEQVMELIRTEMKDRGTAAVVVTHDERITRFTDRTVHIRDGVLEA